MEHVHVLLESETRRLEEALRGAQSAADRAALIGQANQTRATLALLLKCEAFGVTASSIFTRLPDQTCPTPSSEYRVMEDVESDDRTYWVEAKKDGGRELRLHEGDVVIEV